MPIWPGFKRNIEGSKKTLQNFFYAIIKIGNTNSLAFIKVIL